VHELHSSLITFLKTLAWGNCKQELKHWI